ncbi:UvrD-helicase domain-containing protein [Fluviicola sp.]|uniref:UvrD-helicase domain-containing protein n=1 Tax=Fluviicola sp. TaxID=1917219 RepID=UPI0031D66AE4
MAEARLGLEPEVKQILECIDKKSNFLLSGGAGSGKTYSLVQVIRQVIEENPTSMVACMTYTNAAVKEIEERVNHKHLNVTTIHDFLWDNIKHFQKELRAALVNLANDENISKISIQGISPVPDDYFDGLEKGIQYKEYLRVAEGIISHDELLIVAEYLFKKYVRLNDIVKDRYKYIFIDEYQDTSKSVVEIFLTHLKGSKKQNVIGFFGDAMQSIYDEGIGNLDEYKNGGAADEVFEIKKVQNRRSPQKVITLANRLRTDGIVQEPSSDKNAPNMFNGAVKQGEIIFLHSTNQDLTEVRKFLSTEYGWDFENAKTTKELNLTHNLIADKVGFRTLMDIYDKDPIMALKKDIWEKIKANRNPEIVVNEDDTFDIVVDKYKPKNRSRQLKKDLILEDPDQAHLYNQLKDKLFSEVRKMYLDKDALIDDKKQDEDDENRKGSKRDNLIKHLFNIQTNISLYSNGNYNEFLRVTDYRFKIKSVADKKALKKNIESLIVVGEKTIEEVITEANEKGICLIDDRLEKFKEHNEYLYGRVKAVKFREFQKLYEYLEGRTPFSTQHKTKGAEFDNVLVILDNGNWNDYNFEYLFTNRTDKESVLNRTKKLFYVCCTRSKEKLAVFYFDPKPEVISTAESWFGKNNVKKI